MWNFTVSVLLTFLVKIALGAPARHQDYLFQQLMNPLPPIAQRWMAPRPAALQPFAPQLQIAQLLLPPQGPRPRRPLFMSPWYWLAQGTCCQGSIILSAFRNSISSQAVANIMIQCQHDYCIDLHLNYILCISITIATMIFQLTFHKPFSKFQIPSTCLSLIEMGMLLYWYSGIGEETIVDGANLMIAGQSLLALTLTAFVIFFFEQVAVICSA